MQCLYLQFLGSTNCVWLHQLHASRSMISMEQHQSNRHSVLKYHPAQQHWPPFSMTALQSGKVTIQYYSTKSEIVAPHWDFRGQWSLLSEIQRPASHVSAELQGFMTSFANFWSPWVTEHRKISRQKRTYRHNSTYMYVILCVRTCMMYVYVFPHVSMYTT